MKYKEGRYERLKNKIAYIPKKSLLWVSTVGSNDEISKITTHQSVDTLLMNLNEEK